MSVQRLFGIELDRLVESAEGFLDAACLPGLQSKGAEVGGEIV